MNIALDATYSAGRNLTGVGVYSNEILTGLANLHPEIPFLFCYRAHRLLRSFRQRLPRNAHRTWLRSGGYGPRRAALFHGLNQRVERGGARRIVSTFHDLFVLTGDYSTPEFRTRFTAQAREAAERSDLIITVSEFTAGQVMDILGVERSRIRVVHHGVRPAPPDPPGDDARENMILHVGAIQHRKNLLALIEAFEAAPPEWRLVLAGSAGYGSEQILERINNSPRRESIEVTGYVTDERLDSLYARARLFAFPSLDEGFGMPVLDAMARGVPVLTSNRSATREVAGNAALLIDPRDVDSVRSGLVRVVSNQALRKQLREAGLRRSGEFSWDKAVRQTWDVYNELV